MTEPLYPATRMGCQQYAALLGRLPQAMIQSNHNLVRKYAQAALDHKAPPLSVTKYGEAVTQLVSVTSSVQDHQAAVIAMQLVSLLTRVYGMLDLHFQGLLLLNGDQYIQFVPDAVTGAINSACGTIQGMIQPATHVGKPHGIEETL